MTTVPSTVEHAVYTTHSISNHENFLSYVRPILLFLSYSYVESHLDDDSCLPICKTIPVISNTPHQTHFIRNSIFLHFVMVMTVLWAELWAVVARCNPAGNVGILQQNYFDKLDTWVSQSNILLAYCVFYWVPNRLGFWGCKSLIRLLNAVTFRHMVALYNLSVDDCSMHQGFNLRKPLTAWPGRLSFFQCVDSDGGYR